MSVPGHLLAFGHSLGYDLLDNGFCKTSGDSGPLAVLASVVRHRIRVQFQVADGLQQGGPELSNSILLFKQRLFAHLARCISPMSPRLLCPFQSLRFALSSSSRAWRRIRPSFSSLMP